METTIYSSVHFMFHLLFRLILHYRGIIQLTYSLTLNPRSLTSDASVLTLACFQFRAVHCLQKTAPSEKLPGKQEPIPSPQYRTSEHDMLTKRPYILLLLQYQKALAGTKYTHAVKSPLALPEAPLGPEGMAGVVKIMVPFWVPIIIRGLIRGLI